MQPAAGLLLLGTGGGERLARLVRAMARRGARQAISPEAREFPRGEQDAWSRGQANSDEYYIFHKLDATPILARRLQYP